MTAGHGKTASDLLESDEAKRCVNTPWPLTDPSDVADRRASHEC